MLSAAMSLLAAPPPGQPARAEGQRGGRAHVQKTPDTNSLLVTGAASCNQRSDKNRSSNAQARKTSHLSREHRSLSTSSSISSSTSSSSSSSMLHIYPLEPPPPRPWIATRLVKQQRPARDRQAEFTVLSYNVLADRMVNRNMFPDSPDIALNWLYRRDLILSQLLMLNADVIALQELELDAYETFFKPELLRRANLESIFEPKSRARTMDYYKRRRVDGCAIFFRADKFRLIDRHLLEFTQIAIANAKGCPDMINRVMPRDNIGLVAVLELIEHPRRQQPQQQARRLLICNTHIHWDPEFCDVKLIQTILLMNELESISRYHLQQAGSQAHSADLEGAATGHLPLVLLGDFNSLPSSGVLEYLRSGKIHSHHQDFKNFSYARCSNALSIYNGVSANSQHADGAGLPFSLRRQSSPAGYYGSAESSPASDCSGNLSPRLSAVEEPEEASSLPSELSYKHSYRLASAYRDNLMPYTNYTSKFRAVIDYIFFSSDSIEVLGLLGPLDSKWLKRNQISGFPQPYVPSDHLPLVARLRLSKPIKRIHRR